MKTRLPDRIIVFFVLMLLSLLACGILNLPETSEAPETQLPGEVAPTLVARPGGSTYYVREDGGSAAECTGLRNAPYPGSGTDQPCAWDHPFRALPPDSAARIAGGDTLIIGEGSYMMGYGAPGAENCENEGSYDCLMSPLPSGPDASQPTRVLGEGWDSGCAAPARVVGERTPVVHRQPDGRQQRRGRLPGDHRPFELHRGSPLPDGRLEVHL